MRFFSEKALLFALLEKHDLPRDCFIRYGNEEAPPDLCAALLREEAALLAGEPLQYYLGTAPFCDLLLETAPGVLIPRPETAVLVEKAVEIVPENALIFDFCCGSGCVGAAVLSARKDLFAVLFDLSPEALALSRRNLERLSLSRRGAVERLDVLSPAAADTVRLRRPALILANPPYLTGEEMKRLPDNVRREPALALFGGEDGLTFYRAFADLCRETGVPILAEIGWEQGKDVLSILGERGLSGEIYPDEEGRDRVLFIRPGQG